MQRDRYHHYGHLEILGFWDYPALSHTSLTYRINIHKVYKTISKKAKNKYYLSDTKRFIKYRNIFIGWVPQD